MKLTVRRGVHRGRCTAIVFCVVSALSASVRAADPVAAPPAPDAVERAISAPYLTPDELRDKRIFFGRWTSDDLNTPARTARAALVRGVYDDPSFASPDADLLDRAEASMLSGKPQAALDMLKDQPADPDAGRAMRAVRIRAESLEMLGKFDDAVAAAQPALDQVVGKVVSDPEAAVEGVHLITLRIRLRGPAAGGAADFTRLMQILGGVRDRLDRLYWPSLLAEAELLYAKDNVAKAQDALKELLTLNPSCARGWALIGRIFVDAFAFDQAEAVAARLDILACDDYDAANPNDDPATPPVSGGSLYSAAIVAREMLRQVDGAQALAALEPALKRYPTLPGLLALRTAAHGAAFDFAAVDADIKAFDELYPGAPAAYYEVGKALAEARQYAESAAFLDEAHKRQPFAPEPLIDRGLLEVQAGRDDEARAALEQAFELDPFNTRADNSLRLVRELASYERIETPHYTIRYKPVDAGTPAPDAILAREMPDVLEENYRLDTAAPTVEKPGGIDHRLPEGVKTTLDLMPDHKWFGVLIAGMPRIHTVAASTGPVIAMESPREGPDHLGTYDWARVVRHEYAHTISLSRTDNRIPHWYTEACAVYLEYGPRDWPTCEILAQSLATDTLFDFTEINIAFVRPKKQTDRSKAYAQGEWMYEFIIERFGPRAPLDLMDQYAKGVREEQAFQNVLKLSRADFFELFKGWAKKQVVSWGLSLPEGVPSVSVLLKEAAAATAKPAAQKPDAKGAEVVKPPATEAEGGDEQAAAAPEATPEMVASWLERYPNHPDVLELAMDQALRKTARLATPESAPIIERYAAARPVDPRPHRLLAKMYLDRAELNPDNFATEAAKAIPHLEFLDQREQYKPVYAMELARRYAALGDFAKAQAAATRATRISPFDAPARELAATVALQAKDYAAAERNLLALSQIEPTRDIHKKRLEALAKLRAQVGK